MARRNPPAKWVLPDVVNPPDHICFTIPVPNNRLHIGAFFGALFNLTSARFWQDDTAHTARQVAAVWRAIFDSLEAGACDFNVPDIIEEMDYEMSICEQLRFHNGKLQGLCCGVWTDIAGQTGVSIGGPDQEGQTPTPGPGACTTYHAQFAASSLYLLPVVVNAGDTLTFTNANGAGQDGTLAPWHCPDGSTFFAGACVGVGGTSGGDPAAAINHMALIVEIDGTFYPAFSGVITVPGGVVNAEVRIQTNDSTIADNSGSYALDVEYCNNAAPSWSSTLDFQLNSFSTIRSGGYGIWSPGVGLLGESNGSEPHVIQPWLDTDAFELLAYIMTYDAVSVGGSGPSNGLFQVGAASGYLCAPTSPTAGVDQTTSCTGDALAVTQMQPTINSGATGGQVTLKKLVIQGRGPKPVQLP